MKEEVHPRMEHSMAGVKYLPRGCSSDVKIDVDTESQTRQRRGRAGRRSGGGVARAR